MKNKIFSRSMILVSAVLLLGSLLFLVQSGRAAGTTSTIIEIDDDGNVGVGTAVAINSLNQEVIAYHDFTNSSLKIALCDTEYCTNPEIETVDNDGDVGLQPSIVINAEDRPVISYYDQGLGDLKLAVCSDPACSTADIRTVAQTGDVGLSSSIVLDDMGRPIISYYDLTNKDLKIAYCDTLVCTAPLLVTVDDTGFAGLYSSLTLDDNGLAVIAYYELINGDLKVALCNDATCSAPSIKIMDAVGDAGRDASLSMTAGRIFVSYLRINGGNGGLKLARCDDFTCDNVTVLDVIDMQLTGYNSMVINDDGQVFISFWDGSQGDLIVVACLVDPIIGCEGATFTRLDRFFVTGLYTDITLDQEGTPVVSYFDQEEEALNLATCPLCRVPVRTDIGPVALEDSISLVLTEEGYPITTYQNAADNNFYLVYCQDTICSDFEKTSLGTNLHINPSMQLQDNGRPAVAYYHASTNELKLTVCHNDDCTGRTTNVIAFDGFDPSLRFNSLKLPVISFYDAGSDDLVLATCDDVVCSAPVLTIVDDTGQVGSHTSMVLTPEDTPIISYYDETNDTIKWVLCDDTVCSNPDIRNIGLTDGPYSAIARSEEGHIHIAYYDSGNQILQALRCSYPCDGGWGTVVVDNSAVDVGLEVSIALTQDGYPLISYYDNESGVLRMAICITFNTCGNATISVVDTMGWTNGRFSAIALNSRDQPVIAHANLTSPSARIVVYDTQPTLTQYQVYAPVVLGQ